MKSLLIALFILPVLAAQGQSHFRAEGKKTKMGIVVRTYNFHYILPDSIQLSDSTITRTSADKRIVKETIYWPYAYDKTSHTRITYKGHNGKDSITKQGKKLDDITEYYYDSIGRLVSKTSKSPTYLWCSNTYTYRDSVTTAGRWEIRSRQTYCAGNRQNNYLEIYEYDTENKLVKRRNISGKDTLIAYFIYNTQGLPTGAWTSMNGALTAPGETCFNRTERSMTAKGYIDYYHLARQLLRENSLILRSPECHHLSLRYTTPEGNTDIEIRRTLEYRASLQSITVIIKK